MREIMLAFMFSWYFSLSTGFWAVISGVGLRFSFSFFPFLQFSNATDTEISNLVICYDSNDDLCGHLTSSGSTYLAPMKPAHRLAPQWQVFFSSPIHSKL